MSAQDKADARSPAASADLDPESQEWVRTLTGDGMVKERAVARLHGLLRKAAHTEANKRAGIHGIQGPELDDLADQAASDAVVSILRKVPDFRGDSRFTTWAYKFVVFEVSSKFGRHIWRRHGVQLNEEHWEQLPSRLGGEGSPESVAEGLELAGAVQEAVACVLTSHQRRVFVAVVLHGVPLDVLVVEMNTNRNSIYKTVFDARKKLRAHLDATGFLSEEGQS